MCITCLSTAAPFIWDWALFFSSFICHMKNEMRLLKFWSKHIRPCCFTARWILTSNCAYGEQWTFVIFWAVWWQSEDAWIDGALFEGGHIKYHQIIGLLINDVGGLGSIHLPVVIVLQTLLIPNLIFNRVCGIVPNECRVRQPVRSNSATTTFSRAAHATRAQGGKGQVTKAIDHQVSAWNILQQFHWATITVVFAGGTVDAPIEWDRKISRNQQDLDLHRFLVEVIVVGSLDVGTCSCHGQSTCFKKVFLKRNWPNWRRWIR